MTTKIFHPRTLLVLLLLTLSACNSAPATVSPSPVPPTETTAPSPGETPNQTAPTASPTAELDAAAQVNEVVNEIRARTAAAEDFRQVAEGEILPLQGELQSGENSQARLDILPDGTVVHVGPNTHLRLDELGAQDDGLYTRLRLWAGNLWIVLNGGQLDVETPNGVASVRGSYMSVTYNETSERVEVTCLEGHCVVENDHGKVEMTNGQASAIPAPGLPPAQPRQMTPEEYQEWLNAAPEADPYIPPEEELPPIDEWLYVDAYNGCLTGETDGRGSGDWTLTFYNLSDGSSQDFVLAPEEVLNMTLPAGGYKLELLYPDGSQRLIAVDEADAIFLDRCPETNGTESGDGTTLEGGEETTVTIVNTCEEAWYWDFSGPAAFSVVVAPGETYSEVLPPGDYNALRWWESTPDQTEEIFIPAGSDYYSASSCSTDGTGDGSMSGSTGGEAIGLPVAYYLENPCGVTWFWKFTGPTTIQLTILPGDVAVGSLLPVGSYMGYDWYDVAAPTITESGPFMPGDEIYVIASCNY